MNSIGREWVRARESLASLVSPAELCPSRPRPVEKRETHKPIAVDSSECERRRAAGRSSRRGGIVRIRVRPPHEGRPGPGSRGRNPVAAPFRQRAFRAPSRPRRLAPRAPLATPPYCQLGGQHNARQQHNRMSGRPPTTLLPDMAPFLFLASTPCDHYAERRPCRRPTTTPRIWQRRSPRSRPRGIVGSTSFWNSSPRPAGSRGAVVLFATAREAEADLGLKVGRRRDAVQTHALPREELDVLLAGFRTIRDQETLDDVADWANAVVALLEDEAARTSSN